jgi:hypothetical protein
VKPYDDDTLEADLRAAIDAGDAEQIQSLGAEVDARQHRPAATLHQAALYYAERGLHVFPLTPGTKIPVKCSGGFKDATTERAQIDLWWTGNPNLNIGIATGHLIDVIDIDGPAGVRSWVELRDDLPPILGKVSTPRPGGNHLYVAAVPGRGNKAGIFPAIDYRGTGGYVVAPPSVIVGGDNPGAYTWYAPLDFAALGMAAAA